MSQPFGVSCRGGLNTNLNQFEMLRQPGLATKLKNFEVDPDGGYRRISGFTPFGDTRPNGANKILGITVYGDGIVVCSGTDIHFSIDGTTWLKINRAAVQNAGDNYATFTGRATLTRTNQGQCTFALFEGANYDYGQLIIADGANDLYLFRMEGTGDLTTRTFFAEEVIVNGSSNGVKYITIHDHHLVAAGVENNLSTVYYSVYNDPSDFGGSGAGAVTISDQITGIKGFREDLFVFCRNSIHRLANINDPQTVNISPVTENVGCLSGYSIQEIGGDVLFLSPDGIRTIAGTARIGDVELGSISRQIQQIITGVASNIDSYTIDSVVLRSKSQYRLFYTNASQPNYTESKGIIGTLTSNGFEWSETEGIQALGLTSGFNSDNIEKTFHGDKDGYIYSHDTGNQFNPGGTPTNIAAVYETPNFDFGDIGTRKTLKYVRVSFSPEGTCEPYLKVSYDFEDPAIPQPALYYFDVPIPSVFGTAVFNAGIFGGTNDPMARQTVEGSGNTISFRIGSDDQRAPYAINGLYVDYMPSGRR